MAYIGLSFERLYRNPACGVATLVLNEFKIFALRQTTCLALGRKFPHNIQIHLKILHRRICQKAFAWQIP